MVRMIKKPVVLFVVIMCCGVVEVPAAPNVSQRTESVTWEGVQSDAVVYAPNFNDPLFLGSGYHFIPKWARFYESEYYASAWQHSDEVQQHKVLLPCSFLLSDCVVKGEIS